MLIELTVYWFPDDYDPEKYEELGIKPELTLGISLINSDHIVSFNPHDDGETMVHLSNGEVFKTTLKFEEFRRVMDGIHASKDIFVSGQS